jgi:LuxR family transcriptional regulator, maltose regulon positive regulatory protein
LGEAEALSEREIEVLHFLRSSLSVSEIAAMLCVAESTVRSHIKSIYSKLGVHRRMEAVERAQALGLFESGQASLNEPLG